MPGPGLMHRPLSWLPPRTMYIPPSPTRRYRKYFFVIQSHGALERLMAAELPGKFPVFAEF